MKCVLIVFSLFIFMTFVNASDVKRPEGTLVTTSTATGSQEDLNNGKDDKKTAPDSGFELPQANNTVSLNTDSRPLRSTKTPVTTVSHLKKPLTSKKRSLHYSKSENIIARNPIFESQVAPVFHLRGYHENDSNEEKTDSRNSLPISARPLAYSRSGNIIARNPLYKPPVPHSKAIIGRGYHDEDSNEEETTQISSRHPIAAGTSRSLTDSVSENIIARNPIFESRVTPIFHARKHIAAYFKIVARNLHNASRVTQLTHSKIITTRKNQDNEGTDEKEPIQISDEKSLTDKPRSLDDSKFGKNIAGTVFNESRVTQMSHSRVNTTRINQHHKGTDENEPTGNSGTLDVSKSGTNIAENVLNKSRVTQRSHSRVNSTRINKAKEGTGENKPTGISRSLDDSKSRTNITRNVINESRVTQMSHSRVNTSRINQEKEDTDENEPNRKGDEEPLIGNSGPLHDSKPRTNTTRNALKESRVTQMSHSRVNTTRINRHHEGSDEKEPIEISDEKPITGNSGPHSYSSELEKIIERPTLNESRVTQMSHSRVNTTRINQAKQGTDENEPTGNSGSLDDSKSRTNITRNALNKSRVTQMSHSRVNTTRINWDDEGKLIQISEEKPLTGNSRSHTNSSQSEKIISRPALNESRVTQMSHSRVNNTRRNQEKEGTDENETTGNSGSLDDSKSRTNITRNALDKSRVTRMPQSGANTNRTNHHHEGSGENEPIGNSGSLDDSKSGPNVTRNALNKSRVTQRSHSRVNTTRINRYHEGKLIQISEEKPLTGNSRSHTNSSQSEKIISRPALNESRVTQMSHSRVNTTRINQEKESTDENELTGNSGSLDDSKSRTNITRNALDKSRLTRMPHSGANTNRTNHHHEGSGENEPIGNSGSLDDSKSGPNITRNALNKSRVTQRSHSRVNTTRINRYHEGKLIQKSEEKPLTGNSRSHTYSSQSEKIVSRPALNESRVTQMSHSRVNNTRRNQEKEGTDENEPTGNSGSLDDSKSRTNITRNALDKSRLTRMPHSGANTNRTNHHHEGSGENEPIGNSVWTNITRNALNESRVTQRSHSRVNTTRINRYHEGKLIQISEEKPLTGNSRSHTNSSQSEKIISRPALNESRVTQMSHSRVNATRINQTKQGTDDNEPTGNSRSHDDSKSQTNITRNALNKSRVTQRSHARVNTTRINRYHEGKLIQISEEKPLTGNSRSHTNSSDSEKLIARPALNESRVTQMSHSRVNTTRINQEKEGTNENKPNQKGDEEPLIGISGPLYGLKPRTNIARNAPKESRVTSMSNSRVNTTRINQHHESTDVKELIQITERKLLTGSSESHTNSSKSDKIIGRNALNVSRVTQISHSRVNTTRIKQDEEGADENEPIQISDEKNLTGNTGSVTDSKHGKNIVGNELTDRRVKPISYPGRTVTQRINDVDSKEKELTESSLERPPTRSDSLVFESPRNFISTTSYIPLIFYPLSRAVIQQPSTSFTENGFKGHGNHKQFNVETSKPGLRAAGLVSISIQNSISVIGLPLLVA